MPDTPREDDAARPDPADDPAPTPRTGEAAASGSSVAAGAAARRKRRPPVRALLAGVLVIVLVGALAAAVWVGRSGGETVATVNGTDISDTELEEATAGDTTGGDEESLTARRQVLSLLVADKIISGAAEAEGVEPTAADVEAARSQLLESLGGEDGLAPALEQAGMAPQLFDEVVVPQQAAVLALGRSLVDGRDLTTRTVRHVLTEDRETAQAARDEIEDGADFAAVAQERSIDTNTAQQGGELPPLPRGQLPDALDEAVWAAEPDTLQGPVDTGQGWDVFEVTAQDTTAADDLDVSQVAQVAGAEVTEVLQAAISDAEVTVAEELGSWDPEQQTIVPPEGAEQPQQPLQPQPQQTEQPQTEQPQTEQP